ncbi:uncharacterized protein N7482_004507 [Penicillium canariense]|uniref:Ankyrin repeat protein n=1 Tax=Penicillium canariense TaxID=189055 RepID=A0A9W9I8T5_9EURO|nr:uncharacterized protein N7482_004507 [Penicillium canariense]KAJ5168913.1 hypothetical protein N7482_004507 [Penicillium canariense]
MSEPTIANRMLKACEAGDLPALQQLFQSQNIKPGTQVRWQGPSDSPEDSPPPTHELVTAAIAHAHVPVISFILSIYSKGDISCGTIVQGIINNPSLEILALLYRHSPGIVNFEFDPLRTFLTEACRGPQSPSTPASSDQVALLDYLLDHGAAPDEGALGGCGALLPAIESGWVPLEIMKKMLARGAVVGIIVFGAAVRMRRVDVLRLFFEKAEFSGQLDPQTILEKARGSGDREVVAVVDEGIKKLEQRKNASQEGASNSWWQFWKQA